MSDNLIKCPHCSSVFPIDESSYSEIVKQIRTAEFQKDVEQREKLLRDNFASQQQAADARMRQQMQSQMDAMKAQHQEEVSKIAMQNQAALAQMREDNAKLQNQIAMMQQAKQIDIQNAVVQKDQQIASQTAEIIALKSTVEQNKLLADQSLQRMQHSYEDQLRMKDDVIASYRDFKAKQSTKMVGEDLEQWCYNEFNKVRQTAFPGAIFEKDNTVSKSGSKGDFVFKEYDPAMEDEPYISIMFDMKNESETTDKSMRHKNEDFFKELDKDRREKKCEYAVLVSTLEADNDFYNGGIADVSYRYPKMYVVRPQSMIALITLLRDAARKTLDIKRRVYIMEKENIDYTSFINNLTGFKLSFEKNCQDAGNRFADAMASIDRAIKSLEKTKEALRISGNHLTAANNKVQDMTLRKLTANSPSIAEGFKEAQKQLKEFPPSEVVVDVESYKEIEEETRCPVEQMPNANSMPQQQYAQPQPRQVPPQVPPIYGPQNPQGPQAYPYHGPNQGGR